MPDTPTPGQVAYAAYCRVVYGAQAHPADYHTLSWGQQEAWEAVAQAVRALGKDNAYGLATRWALVHEATPFLHAAFGGVLRRIDMRLHADSDGHIIMRVVARVASNDTSYLDGLLRVFDDTWWLSNCHRAGAGLVFDYETIPLSEDTPHA